MPRNDPAPGFDPGFRPDSYWDATDPLAAIVGSIKGEHRRTAVHAFVTGNVPAGCPPIAAELLADELDEVSLDRLRSVAPAWLAGEALPRYGLGEVEIARVVVPAESVTTVSLRARRAGGGICYRMFDDDGRIWTTARLTSARPLTFEQLVKLLDTARCDDLGEDERDTLIDWAARLAGEARVAVRVSSVHYPQLAAWYDRLDPGWVDSYGADEAEEEVPGPGYALPEYRDALDEHTCTRDAAVFTTLARLGELVANAADAAAIVRIVHETGIPAQHAWGEAASAARHWDQALWDRVSRAPGGLYRVTANRHVPPEWERMVVRMLVTLSASDGGYPPGPMYRGLERLARRGVLARHPRALATLANRLKAPPRCHAEAMNAHPNRVWTVIMACPELPPRFVRRLDQLISARGGEKDGRRALLADHPSVRRLRTGTRREAR